MCGAGHPKPVLCHSLEGWGEEGCGGVGGFRREGTHVCLWPIHVDVWQRPLQCCYYPPIKLIFLKSTGLFLKAMMSGSI